MHVPDLQVTIYEKAMSARKDRVLAVISRRPLATTRAPTSNAQVCECVRWWIMLVCVCIPLTNFKRTPMHIGVVCSYRVWCRHRVYCIATHGDGLQVCARDICVATCSAASYLMYSSNEQMVMGTA